MASDVVADPLRAAALDHRAWRQIVDAWLDDVRDPTCAWELVGSVGDDDPLELDIEIGRTQSGDVRLIVQATIKLVHWNPRDASGNRTIDSIVEQQVYLLVLPIELGDDSIRSIAGGADVAAFHAAVRGVLAARTPQIRGRMHAIPGGEATPDELINGRV